MLPDEQIPRHRITFEPMGVAGLVADGTTLGDAAGAQGIALRSDCCGQGLCGKCRVTVHPNEGLSPPTEAEREALEPGQIRAGERLACQARVTGPLAVTIPLEGLETGTAVGKTELRGTYPVDPMVERLFIPGSRVSSPMDEPVRDLVERVRTVAHQHYGKAVSVSEPAALRELSQPLTPEGDITLVHHGKKGVTAVLRGRRERSLGVAVDVGTTTLAVYLCDLRTGEVLKAAGSANPQRRFGEDVISRIAYANEGDSGAPTLHRIVVEEVDALMARCLEAVRAHRADVDEVTVVGNTTMLTLFAGLHPHSIGISPYLPATRSPMDLRAGDLGLDLNPGTNVHLFPVITGFVGGDTVGAILAERPHERDEITLIVDIGTNGELVLGNWEGLWATSCATGPALEGAHLSCGMRAVPGAIHRVAIDPAEHRITWEVLGGSDGARAQGLCGSGIIDAVAAMRRAGLLLPSGRMAEGMPGVAVDDQGIGRRFLLVPAAETATGRDLTITLQDIRQVQLAKAALSVGIRFLMRRAGVGRLDRMVLTGAFGARFDWRNAVAIGMLPEASCFSRVEVVENAAGMGGIMALLDRRQRDEARRLAESTQAMELAEEPDFGTAFPMAVNFPALDGEPEYV